MRVWTRTFSLGGLLTLVACQGPPGEAGKNGFDGEDGAAGQNGAPGQDGQNGQNGQDGQDGLAGQDGAAGQDGLDGQNGQDGLDGQDGQDGQDGRDGVDGRDGHNGDAPWGLNLDVLSVTGGSGPGGAFQVGDQLTITFSILDDDDREYDLSELSGLSFQFSGPTTHYQNVIQYNELASPLTNAVYNYDGTWSYTTNLPIPAVYDTPLNNTADLGVDDGDWSGLPLDDGTYTLGAWASFSVHELDGTTWTEGSNDEMNVLFGAATSLEPREVVLASNCAACHGPEFRAHGGSRQELALCLTCHVDGAEDRRSAQDPTLTPGETISMRTMVHKIHTASKLSAPYELAGFPADPNGIGYPDYNLVDFSDVGFPRWPMETADCYACHGGAAQGDVQNRPSREDCGTCHDTVDFTETDPLATDYHPGGPQADDSNCSVCHNGVFVAGYHDDPRSKPAVWQSAGHAAGKSGVNVEILDAVDQGGSPVFDAGDTITVHFTLKYDDGTDIPQSFFAYSPTSSTCGTIAGGATFKFAGPSDHLQTVLSSPSPSSTTTVGSVWGSSIVDPGTGVWEYTFQDTTGTPLTIPATYPAQSNDASMVGIDYGDLVGQALRDGTYRLALDVYTTMWEDQTCINSVDRVRAPALGTHEVLVGAATTLEPHQVVDDATCGSCHNEIQFHGNSRVGVDYCVTCHTPGAMDDATNPLVTIDFPVMIHKIHASDGLDAYAIDGRPYDVGFPRQDGGVAACEACHGANPAWQNASSRACVTCHEDDATVAHAALNTDPTYGEACDVCHGPGSTFSVEVMHLFLR